jgi:hypothetical protein
MELQDLIARFRSEVSDEDQPYLWSDPDVLQYAIEAQDMLVRLTGGIRDVTVAAADVGAPPTRLADLVLADGSPYTAFSPYILRIRSGRLLTVARDVTFIQEADMGKVMVRDYGFSQGLSFDDADEGDVQYGVLGVRDKFIRWVRVPNAADTCRLHVMRLPYPRIEEQEDDLEVDAQYHAHLLDWMKYLGYSKQDAEARNDKQAATFRASFMAYADQARAEVERQRYKVRTVQYGGI